MLFSLLITFLIAVKATPFYSLSGIKRNVVPNYSKQPVYQINLTLIDSNPQNQSSSCWVNKKSLQLGQQIQVVTFYNTQLKISNANQHQTNKNNVLSNLTNLDFNSKILDFQVVPNGDIYVVRSAGSIYYIKCTKYLKYQTPVQMKLSQQTKSIISEKQFHLVPLQNSLLIIANKKVFLLERLQKQRQIFQFDFSQDIKTIRSFQLQGIQYICVVSTSAIRIFQFEEKQNSLILKNNIQNQQNSLWFSSIMDVNLIISNKQTSTVKFYILNYENGVYTFQLQNVTQKPKTKLVLQKKQCNKMQVQQHYIILNCFSQSGQNIVKAEIKPDAKYQLTQSNEQFTKFLNMQTTPNYYAISRKTGVYFYWSYMNMQAYENHNRFKEISQDDLVKFKFQKYAQNKLLVYSTQEAVTVMDVKESDSFISCIGYSNVEQTFEAKYKGMCEDKKVCIKQFKFSFRNIEYKRASVIFDLVVMSILIGFYFYKKNENDEGIERQFIGVEMSSNEYIFSNN